MKRFLNKFLCGVVSVTAFNGVVHAAKLLPEELYREDLIHTFTPPQLAESNKGEKILCVRPMFDGSLDISMDTYSFQNKQQHVLTASGFGGSGITLGEGAVDYQLGKFETEIFPSLRRGKDTEIAVIGMGWIGSLTALKLVEAGYKNVIIYTDQTENLTSHNAGGLIAPVSMSNSEEYQKLADQFGIDAYNSYKVALAGQHPFINAEGGQAVMQVPAYFGDRENSGLEPYVKAGVMREPLNVTLQIEDRDVSHQLVCYEDGIFVNTPSILPQFHDHIKHKYQIPITIKRVEAFYDLPNQVIFNCTGLRAGKIEERKNVGATYIPTLGHLIMVQNQDYSSKTLGIHNSMILTYGEESKTSLGHNRTDSFYSFPKHYTDSKTGANYQGVLGGSFIEGVKVDQNGKVVQEHSYPETFKLIWDNTHKFFGERY